MNTLTQQDLQFVVRRIPRDIRDLLTANPLFIAGGFIRETIAGGQVNDIDIFGPSLVHLLDAAHAITKGREARLHKTDNAITILAPPRMPVQFITRWMFDAATPLLESLDFTVCQVVIWFDKEAACWKSEAAPGFYPDLAARRLVYTSPVREEEAGGSLMRVRKFLGRGYNIQATSLGAVVSRVVSKVTNIDSLTEHRRGEVIAGLLHEVDPLLVVDGLEPVNEHAAI